MGSVDMGGRESLFLDIINNRADRFDHTVIGFQLNPAMRDEFEAAGGTVIGLDFSSKADLGEYLRLLQTVRGIAPDVLHAHGPNAQLPARLLGVCLRISVISTHHGVAEMFPGRLLIAERWTRCLDTVSVAVSNGVRDSYAPCPVGERWQTIHNGIDVAEFNNSVMQSDGGAVRAEYGIDPDDTVFLNVGRYVDEKNQEDLIDAMSVVTESHPSARLFIVGGRGGGPEGLRNRARELGVEKNVVVTGRVENIHPYYAATDAFAIASTHEGLPITLLEAMAAKKAVVATDIPGVREVVSDGQTGLLVKPREPTELGAAMIRLTADEFRRKLANAAYERVLSEFNIDTTAAAYEELYQEVAP